MYSKIKNVLHFEWLMWLHYKGHTFYGYGTQQTLLPPSFRNHDTTLKCPFKVLNKIIIIIPNIKTIYKLCLQQKPFNVSLFIHTYMIDWLIDFFYIPRMSLKRTSQGRSFHHWGNTNQRSLGCWEKANTTDTHQRSGVL